MNANYTVDVFHGIITLKRNGCVMRKSGAFPPCACCHPNHPMLKEPVRTFKDANEAWAAADNDKRIHGRD